ncbi:Gfo/Idh/MocA family oxidoreductase [Marinicauda algicola]|uniref:Gfo/Idh/MocA family oxidoreductase n=1 Tax=Marinicauda algicola TaxID=2029849 RepID=A0A4V3RXN3_9PROT|nr:Gfo/Idh/MocA family oxidoreductase [Marinicauda algicola]TGY87179.1 Gfo/Idh/MocA family oxidoreductase [Marinicauda algicola]
MSKTDKPLRAGVVGAGVFGGFHASKYAAEPRAEFIGVFDPVADHARALCERHGGTPFESLHALIEAVDILTVASPAMFHHDAAHRALQAGKAVLVEKPIAATVEEGEDLVSLAEANGVVLQVGHQERFVFDAMGLFGDLPRLDTLHARRMGTPSARNLDVSVTLDLLIHDIDLVLALAGAAPERIEAQMMADRGGLADHVYATLDFPGGLKVTLESSRVAEARDRVMLMGYASGDQVEVDFLNKRFANEGKLHLDPDFAEAPQAKDSLGANVSAFIDAVLDPKARSVAATGRDGLRALETALKIDAAAGSHSRLE